MKVKEIFVPFNSEQPNIVIEDVANLIEAEATINTRMKQGLRLIKMERLRDSFFQSFILYFANAAAIKFGVFNSTGFDVESYDGSEDVAAQPPEQEQKQGLDQSGVLVE